MLELNNIYEMDCIEGMSFLSDDSAQIIIIDPPYNIGKNFGNNKDKKEFNDYINWCKLWIDECSRILKKDGTMFVYGFSEILSYIFVNITLNKRWLVWHYTNKNSLACLFWQRSHESIICCWKDNKIFNQDLVREPYTDRYLKGIVGKKRTKTKGRFRNNNEDMFDDDTFFKAHEDGALPRDVIKIPALVGAYGSSERWFICKDCGGNVFHPSFLKDHRGHNIEKHPTQKPLELCYKLINSCRQDNGYVLVPFSGSGSECVAAQKLKLDYVGFDLNPIYVNLAKERLKNSF